jgi:hypothetical protein
MKGHFIVYVGQVELRVYKYLAPAIRYVVKTQRALNSHAVTLYDDDIRQWIIL